VIERTPPAEKATANIVGPRLKNESPEVETMALSRKRWDRLKEEAKEAKMGWSDLWLGAAFAFFGVAGAAGIARWTLPGPASQGAADGATHLAIDLQHELVWLTVGAAICGALCLAAWLHFRRDHNANLDALIRNMESQEHYDT
jgi:hypothetical protein